MATQCNTMKTDCLPKIT